MQKHEELMLLAIWQKAYNISEGVKLSFSKAKDARVFRSRLYEVRRKYEAKSGPFVEALKGCQISLSLHGPRNGSTEVHIHQKCAGRPLSELLGQENLKRLKLDLPEAEKNLPES